VLVLGTSVAYPQWHLCSENFLVLCWVTSVAGKSHLLNLVMAACSTYPGSEFTRISLKKTKHKTVRFLGNVAQVLSVLKIFHQRAHPMLLILWALLCQHRLVRNYLLGCWVLIILPQNCHFVETNLNIKHNSFVVNTEVVM